MITKLLDTARAYAQTALLYGATFIPLEKIPAGNSKLDQLYTIQAGGDLSSFVNGLFKFAIAVGAIAAVLRIAYAGYLYMGADFWGNKGKAREILTDVVIGLLLLLSIYLILNQINPDILQLKALRNIPQAPASSAPAPSAPATNPILSPGPIDNQDGTCTYVNPEGPPVTQACP